MRLYSATDGYIDYLRMYHKHVYSNKENARVNMRKYIGFIVEENRYKYFIPLSSPKDSDFVTVNGEKMIKKDSFLIFRIVSSRADPELKASIRFANMIPVPSSELIMYDVDGETDNNYRNLILEELEYIRKKEDRIIKRAKVIYRKKCSGNKEKVFEKCLDYKDLERLHDAWIEHISNAII